MKSKSVVYAALVFAFFFVGSVVPLGTLIGAPVSLVVLAFFGPKLSRKLTVEVFVALTVLGFVRDVPDWFLFYSSGQSFLVSVGAPAELMVYLMPLVLGGFVCGRGFIYLSAVGIIRRSKLWQRYPLS